MSPDWPLYARAAISLAKAGTYLVLAVSFWRFRRRSEWRAVCLALVINFGLGAAMTLARTAALFTADDTYVSWAEVGAAVITGLCTWSIVRSVWK